MMQSKQLLVVAITRWVKVTTFYKITLLKYQQNKPVTSNYIGSKYSSCFNPWCQRKIL